MPCSPVARPPVTRSPPAARSRVLRRYPPSPSACRRSSSTGSAAGSAARDRSRPSPAGPPRADVSTPCTGPARGLAAARRATWCRQAVRVRLGWHGELGRTKRPFWGPNGPELLRPSGKPTSSYPQIYPPRCGYYYDDGASGVRMTGDNRVPAADRAVLWPYEAPELAMSWCG